MEKKYYIASFIIVLIVFSAGCTSKGSNSNTENRNYRTGNQGLYLEFVQNMPPYRVYALEEFELMIKMTNKGASDINGGYLYISGYDTTYLDSLYSQNAELSYHTFNAVGKSEYNPYGEIYETASFTDDLGPNIPEGVDNFDMSFKATACYEYTTIAAAKICVDPNPANINIERKVCQVKDIGLGTQGAPVAVTKVEEQINRRDILFWIYFKNVGSGDVFVREDHPTDITMCHSNLGFDDLNKVIVESVEVSGHEIAGTCRPEGSVQRLGSNGLGQVMCVCENCVNENLEDTYETILNIKLRYGYRDSLIKKIEVRRNPWS